MVNFIKYNLMFFVLLISSISVMSALMGIENPVHIDNLFLYMITSFVMCVGILLYATLTDYRYPVFMNDETADDLKVTYGDLYKREA